MLARVLYILSVCEVVSLEAFRNLVYTIMTAESRRVKQAMRVVAGVVVLIISRLCVIVICGVF